MPKGSIFTRRSNAKYLAEQLRAVKEYADIISHTSIGDTVTVTAAEEYRCYDRENELPFVLRFEYQGAFGRLRASEDGPFSRKHMLRLRSACERLIKAGEKGLNGHFFARYSPDGCSGVLFFISEEVEAAAEALVERLYAESAVIYKSEDIYLSYTVYVCRGEVYEKLSGTSQDKLNRSEPYYSGEMKGQPGIDAAEYLLGCGFERTCDDGYDIAVLKGEPNSGRSGIIGYKKLRSE